jgi:hypothetical protein
VPNFGTIAESIAARYAAPNLPATPAGARAIRSASANVPNNLPALPCVLVFPDQGAFDAGNGIRIGEEGWLVRLYYDQVAGGSLERDSDQLRDWLSLLVDQHKASLQLSGAVLSTRTMGYRVGILTFAGTPYTGLELRVTTVTSEPWDASA